MAYYDLKKKPALTTKEGDNELLYVQAITAGTIPSDEFLELVSKRFGFRKGEIEGVLMSVFDAATDWINKGFSVEVGDFGFFTGKVKGERLQWKATQDLIFFVEKGIIVSSGRGNQKPYVKVIRQADPDL